MENLLTIAVSLVGTGAPVVQDTIAPRSPINAPEPCALER